MYLATTTTGRLISCDGLCSNFQTGPARKLCLQTSWVQDTDDKNKYRDITV